MKKRLFSVLKKHNYDVYNVSIVADGYSVNERFNITKKALKNRLNRFIEEFENGLINIDQIDSFSGIAALSFMIDDLVSNENYIYYIEGVQIVKS